MYKMFKIILVPILATFITFIVSAEENISLNDLIERYKQYNNKTVVVTGEVIGEQMKRGEYSWININDGTNAMGIWIKNDLAEKIKIFGSYKNKGDIIQVKGVFHINCVEHGGDIDIHADSLSIVEIGYNIFHPIQSTKKTVASILTIISIILISLYYRVK